MAVTSGRAGMSSSSRSYSATNFSLHRISFTLAGFCKSPESSRTDDEKAKVRWTRRRGGAYVVRLEVAIGCREWEHGQHDGQDEEDTCHS
jgi:hypothetical protein